MAKETTAKIARLAARFLSGELKTLSRKQQLSVCASCVSQAEREAESVKVWGMERNGILQPGASFDKNYIEKYHVLIAGDKTIPVLITRAAKRTQAKRKRGK